MKKLTSLIIISCFTFNAVILPLNAAAADNTLSKFIMTGSETIRSVSILNTPFEVIGNIFKDINASKISKLPSKRTNNNNTKDACIFNKNSFNLERNMVKHQHLLQYTNFNTNHSNMLLLRTLTGSNTKLKDEISASLHQNSYIFQIAVLPKSDNSNIRLSYKGEGPSAYSERVFLFIGHKTKR